ncbi:MAG: RadC family protein [Longimicrobiales bacterium]
MRYAIKEWPLPDRPRERLVAAGAASLSTRELIGILVGSGREGHSALEVGAELLRAYDGSLRRMAAVPAIELERASGVGPAVAARVTAALELGRRLAREGPEERDCIETPADVYLRCAPSLRELPQEEFRVLLLNTQNAVVRELPISRGTLDASIVHPREVFRAAIAENAASVILTHNHPSGDPTPSPADQKVTDQLVEAGDMLGIPILDHIIIGDGRFLSFVQAGLMEGVAR